MISFCATFDQKYCYLIYFENMHDKIENYVSFLLIFIYNQ